MASKTRDGLAAIDFVSSTPRRVMGVPIDQATIKHRGDAKQPTPCHGIISGSAIQLPTLSVRGWGRGDHSAHRLARA